jgi:FG-GAP repeat
MRSALAILSAAAAVGSVACADSIVLEPALHSPLLAPFDVFGGDVVLATPALCAVGVRGADGTALNMGAVDTFDLKDGAWTFLERLQPAGLSAGDQFGESLAADGSWLAVSATRHDASGADAGAVWVYQREGPYWRNPQKLLPGMGSDGMRFGESLALAEGVLAIGAPGAAPAGAVLLYRVVDGVWQLDETVVNPTPADGDRFGDAVAVDATRLLVGDPFDDAGATDRGAVHFYTQVGKNWQFGATLLPISASDRQYFGHSLSMRATRLAVGGYGADAANGTQSSGLVEIYDFVGGAWSRSGELRPATAVAGGNFGWDVALEAEMVVVGEPGYSGSAGGSDRLGRAHVFTRQVSGQWTPLTAIEASAAVAQDVFGAAVAIASGRLVSTAPGRDGQRGATLFANLQRDCDQDLTVDILQIAADPSLDCDGDLLLDACQPDTNGNGVPNACDCAADLNGDGVVGAPDLVFVLAEWGNFGQGPADLSGDMRVDAQDVAILLSAWGLCS